MRNIRWQAAPRIKEDKPSGLDAHFDYIDTYMEKKRRPAALRGTPWGLPGVLPRGLRRAAPRPRARGADAYFTP